MRFVRPAVVLVALVLIAAAVRCSQRDEQPPSAPAAPAAPASPREVSATRPEPVPEVVEPRASSETNAPAPGLPLPKCHPKLVGGEGAPLEVTLTGAGLPAAPAQPLLMEVTWTEEGQPRRWFAQLRAWRTTVWLCDESELAVRRGRYRLEPQRVPRTGAVSLFLHDAPPPSEVVVHTTRPGGAPVAGVRLSLTGCAPVETDDGGVAIASCEAVDEPRHAVVRDPWRVAALVAFASSAAEVTVPVLGARELEPGRVGLGFVWESETPVVGSLMEGGPAELAGVRVGDELLEVDGVGVANVDEATRRVVGAPGAPARLKLRRGAEVLLLDVPRSR